MNIILLAAHEVAKDSRVRLPASDRRAWHVRAILRAGVGQSLRVGIVDGPSGQGLVEQSDADACALACTFDHQAPRPRDVLILAIPRPRVLLRCVEAAAALGFARVIAVRSWRTDKSHVAASALLSSQLRAHALLGLEQAQRTHLPAIDVFPLFKPCVEDHLDAACGNSARFVADPATTVAITALPPLRDLAIALAIGPELGFTPYELDLLASRAFVAVSADPHPLRVETAMAFVFGQLASLRRPG